MSVQNVTAVHAIIVEIFQSRPSGELTGHP